MVPAAQFVGAPEPAKVTNAQPLSAEQERAAFTLPPGFEIELVAAESDGIGKFVTVDWDIHGRMWSMTALEYPVYRARLASIFSAFVRTATTFVATSICRQCR